MTSPTSTERPVRRRPAPVRATVTRRTVLSPHLVRITVTLDDLDRFRWPGPAAHLKLMLPEPGSADVVLPEADAEGTVAFTPAVMPTMRTYTARQFDAASRELDIDVVLHGVGPASRWAETAALGDRLAVSIPRAAGFTLDPDADWLLLAGDASALPALATIADISPDLAISPAIVIEVTDAADRIDLGRTVDWLISSPSAAAGELMEQHLATMEFPSGRGQVWVAGESGSIRRIRADLLGRLGPGQIATRGYWRQGTQNHPDHDYGDEG
jgi:NADPH-dependent ferric siderophore reductase